ncbi:MAG: TIGR03792 family protein [Ilumatobacteraceae bacterium]|nr:TIGR03792 family protein [Ilumatobacteraceae bacterium]
MVIEFLTFQVPPDELESWLDVEERHWSRFLERQDGFVKKEMWRTADAPTSVHAVIWWESMQQWQAIPQRDLDAVIEAMGPHERHAECVAYDVIRSN